MEKKEQQAAEEEKKQKEPPPDSTLESFKEIFKKMKAGDEQATSLVKAITEAMANPKKWILENESFSFSVAGYGDLNLAKEYINSVKDMFSLASSLNDRTNPQDVYHITNDYEDASDRFFKVLDPAKGANLLLGKVGDHMSSFGNIVHAITPAMRNKVENDLKNLNVGVDFPVTTYNSFVKALTQAITDSFKYGNWYHHVGNCNGLYKFFESAEFGKYDDVDRSTFIYVIIGNQGYVSKWKEAQSAK